MNIIDKLRNVRESKKISRKEIANYLNVSSSLISEIEAGRTRLSIDIFLELCEYYEINPLEILKNDDKKYIILNKDDIKQIDKTIEILNKIKTQANSNNIQIGNNNNIQIGNNINYKK